MEGFVASRSEADRIGEENNDEQGLERGPSETTQRKRRGIVSRMLLLCGAVVAMQTSMCMRGVDLCWNCRLGLWRNGIQTLWIKTNAGGSKSRTGSPVVVVNWTEQGTEGNKGPRTSPEMIVSQSRRYMESLTFGTGSPANAINRTDHGAEETKGSTTGLQEIVSRALDPTQRLTTCDHSCIQTMHDVCVDEHGMLLSGLDTLGQRAQAKGRIALVANFNVGQPNRYHVLHEFMFPVMFYIANCWDAKHASIYFSHRRFGKEARCGTLMSDVFEMIHWATAGKIQVPQCSEKGSGLVDFHVQGGCYETVRYLLNPLRTPCRLSRDFRQSLNASNDVKYKGNPGLGQSFRIEGPNHSAELVPISAKLLKRGVHVIRDYYRGQILSKYWYSKGPVRRRRPISSLRITVLNRKDARSRQSMNVVELVEAIRDRYPEIRRVVMYEELASIPHEEQLRLFGMSDIVIAMHGQALANMIVMRPGSLVITQSPPTPSHAWDVSLAEWGGISYENVGCAGSPEEGCPGMISRKITNFDIDGVLETLSKYVPVRQK